MSLKTYDPDDVNQVFFGIPITGYADGTFISIEYNEDSFTLTKGIGEEGCRAKTTNQSARMTFTLLQSSAVNDLLSAVHASDILTPSGDGIGPYLMKDGSGRTVNAAEKAWIVKLPTQTYAREPENREWILETDSMISHVGGNS